MAGLSGPDGRNLLEGKVVAISAAAGSGIGFATAQRCVQEGATVVVSDRHERRLAESAAKLSEQVGNSVLAVPCDVTDQASVDGFFDAVL
ncbi:MAG: 3-oxoacyl-[acyl-carrier protein] reductase, partial [Glaciecola sp.]